MSTLFTTITPCLIHDGDSDDEVLTYRELVDRAAEKHCPHIPNAAALITWGNAEQFAKLTDADKISVLTAIGEVRFAHQVYGVGFPEHWDESKRRTWFADHLTPATVRTQFRDRFEADTVELSLIEEYFDEDTPGIREMFPDAFNPYVQDEKYHYVWKDSSLAFDLNLTEGEEFTWHGKTRVAKIIDPADLHTIICDRLAEIDYDTHRDIAVITIDGQQYYVTAGMSSGDLPTEAMSYLDLINLLELFD